MSLIYAELVDEIAQEVPQGGITPIGHRRGREILDQHLASLAGTVTGSGTAAGEPASAWGLTPAEVAARQQASRPPTRQQEV